MYPPGTIRRAGRSRPAGWNQADEVTRPPSEAASRWTLARVGSDGVLGLEPDLPAQRAGRQVQGVEVVVPRPGIDGVADDRRRGGDRVGGREEPGFAQGPHGRLGQRGAAVERVLGVVAVSRPVPGAGGSRHGGGGARRDARARRCHGAAAGQHRHHGRRQRQRSDRCRASGPIRGAPRRQPDRVHRPQPKPAVAGLCEDGPRAGAGFSAGPDNGATIFPDG